MEIMDHVLSSGPDGLGLHHRQNVRYARERLAMLCGSNKYLPKKTSMLKCLKLQRKPTYSAEI